MHYDCWGSNTDIGYEDLTSVVKRRCRRRLVFHRLCAGRIAYLKEAESHEGEAKEAFDRRVEPGVLVAVLERDEILFVVDERPVLFG